MGGRRRRWRAVVAVATAAVVAGPSSGCFTYSAWRTASVESATGPRVAGVADDPRAAGGRDLVVGYSVYGGRGADLLVPLAVDGRPAGPFAVADDAGRVTHSATIENGVTAYVNDVPHVAVDRLSPAQRTAVLTAAWTRSAADRFAASVAAGRASRAVDGPSYTPAPDIGPADVVLLAYRFDANGRIHGVAIDTHDARAKAIHLPAETRLVLVPTTVPRPDGDQTGDRVVAIAVTPVTVAADAATIGLAAGLTVVFVAVVGPVYLVLLATGVAHGDTPATRPTTGPTTEPVRIGPVALPVVIDR